MQTEPVYRTVYTRWAKGPASQSCFGRHGCTRHVDKHAEETVFHTRFSSHSFTQEKWRRQLLWQATPFLLHNTFNPLRQTLAEAFDIIVVVDEVCAALQSSSVLFARFGPTLFAARGCAVSLAGTRGVSNLLCRLRAGARGVSRGDARCLQFTKPWLRGDARCLSRGRAVSPIT